jgi:hypothetical protein
MEVRIFPNTRRPGIGVRPHREAQRPLLPQHARHCPVLEAGSALGYLVHPPLSDKEAYRVEYLGEGRYQFTYSVNPSGAKWEQVFSIVFGLPVGGIGARREEVTLNIPPSPEARDVALLMANMFMVPDDLGTPPGAITLRGAWNFCTPSGWDTVYSPIFNVIERPLAPMLSIRVETDWYVHESEFRYVLQPGEAISGVHNMPIGQAFFVPREPITLRDCTESEVTELKRAHQEFLDDKATVKLKTPYGLEYSPRYLQVSREQQQTGQQAPPTSAVAGVATIAAAPVELEASSTPGRNAPCPCGSGKKYKKCHGEKR